MGNANTTLLAIEGITNCRMRIHLRDDGAVPPFDVIWSEVANIINHRPNFEMYKDFVRMCYERILRNIEKQDDSTEEEIVNKI